MKRNMYTFLFALAVCVVCSILLSAIAQGLRPRQELNKVLNIKKNILKVVRLREPLPPGASMKEILDTYKAKIHGVVIDSHGNIVPGEKPGDIKGRPGLYPLYLYKENGKVLAYAYPIIGKGLWSTLKGFFCMDPDGMTVRGITFYAEEETPGLGAEIEKPWFQNNFRGKTIWSIPKHILTPITVIKGHVADKLHGDAAQHAVDGITAATLTSNGVSNMLHKWIRIYDPFFSKLRKAAGIEK